MVRAALASVSSDTGLHPLTPYFVNTIAEGVRKHVGDLEVLPRLLGLARALLANKDLHLAPYLKQLLPAVMTALLTSPLGE
jgi:transcription initiation factor TFIID subunit 6